jgi:hypothetical protein
VTITVIGAFCRCVPLKDMPAKKTGRDTVGRTAVEHGAKNRDRPVTVPPPLLSTLPFEP